MKLKKKSECFNVFNGYKFTKEYFMQIYGLNLENVNEYFLRNCFKEEKNSELYAINKELLKYASNCLSEKFEISESDRDLIVYNLLKKKRGEINKERKDNAKFSNQILDEFQIYCNQYLRCEVFLSACRKANRFEEYDMAEIARNAGALSFGAFAFLSISNYLIGKYKINEHYNDIYDKESERLTEEYAQICGFESSKEMEDYFNSFAVEINKKDYIKAANADYESAKAGLLEKYGYSSIEDLQNAIDANVKVLNRKEYEAYIDEKYQIKMEQLASDSGFSSVNEMNIYMAQHSRINTTWGNLVDRWIYDTDLAKNIADELEQMKYDKKDDLRWWGSEKEWKVIDDHTLVKASDDLNAVNKQYSDELNEINKMEFPQYEYSSEDVANAVSDYEHYTSSVIPSEIRGQAESEVPMHFNWLVNLGLPAGFFTCAIMGCKLLNLKHKEIRRSNIVKSLEMIK